MPLMPAIRPYCSVEKPMRSTVKTERVLPHCDITRAKTSARALKKTRLRLEMTDLRLAMEAFSESPLGALPGRERMQISDVAFISVPIPKSQAKEIIFSR